MADLNSIFAGSKDKADFIEQYKRIMADGSTDDSLGRTYDILSKEKKTSFGDFTGGAIGLLKSLETGGGENVSGELIKITDASKELFEIIDKFRSGDTKGAIRQLFDATLLSQVDLYLKEYTSLLETINQQTSLTGDLSRDFRSEIMLSIDDANRLGYGLKDIESGIVTIISEAQRFKLVNQDSINALLLNSRAFFENVESAAKTVDEFEKVSLGVSDAMKSVESVGLKSLGLGLNARDTVRILTENLTKLNAFGFKNGIEGLGKMIRQSQEFGFNMEHAFKVGIDLFDPEEALSMAANLQVIGAAVGDLQDPLKMMYMSVNDIGGLQDAMVKSFENLATFDVASGRFEVIGANLRRAADIAKEFNMDITEVTNTAVRGAQRTKASYDLMSTGLQIDEEQREFLTNLAQMKEGRMVIEVPDNLKNKLSESVYDLGRMTKSQFDELITYQEDLKGLKPEDIAKQQVTFLENINREVSSILSTVRIMAGQLITEGARELGIDPVEYEKSLSKLFKGIQDKAPTGAELKESIKEGLIGIPENFKTKEPGDLEEVVIATMFLGEGMAEELVELQSANVILDTLSTEASTQDIIGLLSGIFLVLSESGIMSEEVLEKINKMGLDEETAKKIEDAFTGYLVQQSAADMEFKKVVAEEAAALSQKESEKSNIENEKLEEPSNLTNEMAEYLSSQSEINKQNVEAMKSYALNIIDKSQTNEILQNIDSSINNLLINNGNILEETKKYYTDFASLNSDDLLKQQLIMLESIGRDSSLISSTSKLLLDNINTTDKLGVNELLQSIERSASSLALNDSNILEETKKYHSDFIALNSSDILKRQLIMLESIGADFSVLSSTSKLSLDNMKTTDKLGVNELLQSIERSASNLVLNDSNVLEETKKYYNNLSELNYSDLLKQQDIILENIDRNISNTAAIFGSSLKEKGTSIDKNYDINKTNEIFDLLSERINNQITEISKIESASVKMMPDIMSDMVGKVTAKINAEPVNTTENAPSMALREEKTPVTPKTEPETEIKNVKSDVVLTFKTDGSMDWFRYMISKDTNFVATFTEAMKNSYLEVEGKA